ncbi:MAG: hypothetical protein HY659_12255 [Rhizobiales bacterium]|nr:hypothetical protein [Hyphomicrobiales bacterium]
MKRLMIIAAIALAVAIAPIATQQLRAEDAHHPGQTTKAKKAQPKAKTKIKATPQQSNKPAPTPSDVSAVMKHSGKTSQSTMMTNCPMMSGGMMGQGGMMNCPMMRSGTGMMQGMNMMPGMGAPMTMNPFAMGRTMMHVEKMMGHMDRCWVATDRDRGYGYWGACNR